MRSKVKERIGISNQPKRSIRSEIRICPETTLVKNKATSSLDARTMAPARNNGKVFSITTALPKP